MIHKMTTTVEIPEQTVSSNYELADDATEEQKAATFNAIMTDIFKKIKMENMKTVRNDTTH